MNNSFIILYAGAPVLLPAIKMVPADEASVFASEVQGWQAVMNHGLTVKHCRVVDLNSFIEQGRKQRDAAPNK